MSTMNISLPEGLRAHVEQKVKTGAYGTNSEYVKDLIRKDLEREQLRNLILEGLESPPASEVDEQFFDSLKDMVKNG